jgi:signal transduction histidine kinase
VQERECVSACHRKADTLAANWLLCPPVSRDASRVEVALARSPDSPASEITSLLDAARDLASTLELRPLLEVLLDHLRVLVGYVGTAILILDGDELVFAGIRNPDSFTWDEARKIRYPVAVLREVWPRLCAGEAVIIPDVRGDTAEARAFRAAVGDESLRTSLAFIRAAIWVPLIVRDGLIGLLTVTASEPDVYTPRDAALALAIARQAAVGIENARLHERARRAAMLDERQRLARELHDSVTQSLYSIALYAEAGGRGVSQGELEASLTNVQEIADTTQEALGEMRLLLFQLRPQHLEEHGLTQALQSRLRAVEARAGLKVDFDCNANQRLPVEMEHELYRLAQEALNNVVKHARAHTVGVRLQVGTQTASLEVRDDGIGFDPSSRGVGGSGLCSMRQRAEQLGGVLHVVSAPDSGTLIRVQVPR